MHKCISTQLKYQVQILCINLVTFLKQKLLAQMLHAYSITVYLPTLVNKIVKVISYHSVV